MDSAAELYAAAVPVVDCKGIGIAALEPLVAGSMLRWSGFSATGRVAWVERVRRVYNQTLDQRVAEVSLRTSLIWNEASSTSYPLITE
jgi:hypothetical protein